MVIPQVHIVKSPRKLIQPRKPRRGEKAQANCRCSALPSSSFEPLPHFHFIPSSAPPLPPPLEPPALSDRTGGAMEKYELLKDIGSGNFGVARLMRNKETKELVAMKYIPRGLKVRVPPPNSGLWFSNSPGTRVPYLTGSVSLSAD
jgi:hypothetical protein